MRAKTLMKILIDRDDLAWALRELVDAEGSQIAEDLARDRARTLLTTRFSMTGNFKTKVK